MKRLRSPNWSWQKTENFHRRLLAWYRRHKRTLPWRSNPTPYRVWVAEIMLQQTRVRTVLPYYERFLDRFPDAAAVAGATQEEVMELWSGLGYYRRARNLWHAARIMCVERNGEFPQTLEEIAQLPGVGRYTAGAIHSIAFNQPQPVVDGNVRRIILRLHGRTKAPESFFWKQAESWLARKEPADFNQAIMELGALVCTPSGPRCPQCPLRPLCRSGTRRQVAPAGARAGAATESVELAVPVIECGDSIILARIRKASFIPGEWGLPVRPLERNSRPLRKAQVLARAILGVVPEFRACAPVRHSITCRRIRAHVFHAVIASPVPQLSGAGQYVWVQRAQAERQLTSSLFRKILNAANVVPKSGPAR